MEKEIKLIKVKTDGSLVVHYTDGTLQIGRKEDMEFEEAAEATPITSEQDRYNQNLTKV